MMNGNVVGAAFDIPEYFENINLCSTLALGLAIVVRSE
jgi:hypothetical protein